jgi:murein DD-endopeptidase MepM/ murein hydrolase activator NlpD
LAPHLSTLAPGSAGVEVTDVGPFSEVDSFAELDFYDATCDDDAELLHAPELDDLTDTDNLVAVRLEYRSELDEMSDDSPDAQSDVRPRIGAHRKPATSALKGRVLIAAMAVGGAAAAAYSTIGAPDTTLRHTVLAAGHTALTGGTVNGGVQLVTVAPISSSGMHSEGLAKGAAFAQERAEREARLQRPLFVKPTNGIFTSGFGYRWGALHAGIDVATAVGTPIYAVADGVVIDAGPTAGYGAWVKLRHADGTVTLYGHVNSWLVSVGQPVMAGDQIATVGSRGNSTGPHLHFEVMPNGQDRIDPVPWLSARGLSVGAYTR